ncbi:hypothetical protein ABXJ56_03505 [Microbacterium chocolatum]|uniref:hypothetical protein n=1 Tax=Microbacterium aurantiacum TaxID=162393 RepID=UPI00338FCB0C
MRPWRNSVIYWAGPPFPLLVMQLVLWLALGGVWTWAAVHNPDAWRVVLSVGSIGLAVLWSITTVAVIRYRKKWRAR